MNKILLLLCAAVLFHTTVTAQKWIELGTGANALNANGDIQSVVLDASGNVYATGAFTNSSGNSYVAKWNGTNWIELATVNNPLFLGGFALALDKSGNLYTGATNTNQKNCIAKWDGSSWTELGANSVNTLNAGNITSIQIDKFGNLYVGSEAYPTGSPNQLITVSKWDGTNWTVLGSNTSLAGSYYGVWTMVIDDTGNVYAAGGLMDAQMNGYVAKWNGTSWAELEGSNSLSVNTNIWTLGIDKSGNIYTGGSFMDVNSKAYVAKFDGKKWSELGSINPTGTGFDILSIISDKAGNIYTAGGGFMDINNGTNYVSKWDGTSWSELGTGSHALNANDAITTLAIDTAGNIYAAGSFTAANKRAYVAKWISDTTATITGITKGLANASINVYPNPGTSQVCLNAPENGVLTIYTLLGEQIATYSIVKDGSYLDLSNFKSGMYTFVFNGQNNSYVPVKWVKE